MQLSEGFSKFLGIFGSVARIPRSTQFLMNYMTPVGYLFMRRFMIWFPFCCIASSFIMQTHVIFDCTQTFADEEEETEFDDSSEFSEEFASPLNTNLNSPLEGGSTADAQTEPIAADPRPSAVASEQQPAANRRRHVQPSELNIPRVPSSWVDLHVPQTPPPDSRDRGPPN